jgi:hypothetical protein
MHVVRHVCLQAVCLPYSDVIQVGVAKSNLRELRQLKRNVNCLTKYSALQYRQRYYSKFCLYTDGSLLVVYLVLFI